MATAGRSITYSGLTVMLAMLVMTIALWPMMLIRTISLAVLICAAAGLLLALTLLPAMLGILGDRTEWLRVIPRREARKVGETGIWYRFSELVMRRPAMWMVGALVLLGLLASPAVQLTTAGPSPPASTEASKGLNALHVAFSGNKLSPVQIVVKASGGTVWNPGLLAGTRQLTADLKADPRVSDVNSLASALATLSPASFDALTPETLGSSAPVAAVYVNTDGD
jgi:putative drug exporter of the RND superfamily